MKYVAEIDIMPHEAILDPQGKAVNGGLKNLGLNGVNNVRIGRHIKLEVEAASKNEAEAVVNEACDKLLCNKIMENYRFTIIEG